MDFPELTDEIAADLKAEHGDECTVLTSGDVTIVVKKPSPAEYDRFMANTIDPAKRRVATSNLVRGALVWPDKKTFGEMLKELPALCEEFADPVLKLVGLRNEAQAKKL